MSMKGHALQSEKEDNGDEGTRSKQLAIPTRAKRRAGWSIRRRRDASLLVVLLLISMVTIFVLSGVVTPAKVQTKVTQPSTSRSIATRAQPTPTSPTTLTAIGDVREYPLPQADSQLMRPAIDHEGRIWFGEMGQNFLAVFDPGTHVFQQMTPPRGRYGVMSVQVASDDTIWFVEQYANYIGHYFPKTGRYRLYPLPTLTIPNPQSPGKTLTLPSAPNELALDAHGTVWFTEMNADALGRLDPQTGLMRHYPLSPKRSAQTLLPYGVAVDPEGLVWFTEVSNDQVGRLDPTSGTIHWFAPTGLTISLMEIASDAHGIIWVTSFSAGLLLSLDPRTGLFTSYAAPRTGPGTGGLYGLAVTPEGEIWVTILAENMIARLDIAAHRFITYTIPTPGSEPLGIVMGFNHTLWFTELDRIGMLRP
jgi:streptogramin lyase